ncbi:hypothetical protein [Larkinella arboricola]
MFKTMSISKAIAQSQGIVLYGTLYLSNKASSYDSETKELVEKSMRLIRVFEYIESYDQKLRIWCDEGLFVTEIWIGDTSRIIERDNAFVYTGSLKPEPDILLSITPTNLSEIIDLNIKNIQICYEKLGSFQQYEQKYLKNLEGHSNNPLYERKLTIDIQQAESELNTYNSFNTWYGTSVQMWYNSFFHQTDMLDKRPYQIWSLNQPFSNPPLFSGKKQVETPYLLNLLDSVDDIIKAAKGYFLHYQIPFLRKLREDYSKKLRVANALNIQLSEQNIESLTNISHSETFTGITAKKSKKKEKQLTTKQQMILLNALGFLDASIIKHLTTTHKAAILAQLLQRSSQEIRCMLTYWNGVNAPKDYDCTHPDDVEKVVDLLTENNLQPPSL